MYRTDHDSAVQHSAKRSLGARCVQSAFMLALVSVLTLPGEAAAKDGLRFRSGLRNSAMRPLGERHLQTILKSLRDKTGLAEMRFDENGSLVVGDPAHFEGGSPVARELILAAIDGSYCGKPTRRIKS
jgi:hypothetical protein